MQTDKSIVQESFFEKDHVGTIGGKIHLLPSHGLVETINYATNAYGYLIQRNERVTPNEFVNRIQAAYDCVDCPQNAAVVRALNHLL